MNAPTLASLLAIHPDAEPSGRFPALFDDRSVEVQAVLERTAVVLDGADKRLVRLDLLHVNPALVQWQPDTGARFSENGAPIVMGKRAFASAHTAPKSQAERAELRRLGDERALKDQAKNAQPAIRVVVKRKAKRSTEAQARAKVVAQQRRREGAPKRCRRCGEVKPRSAFPDVGRGSPSCLACRVATHCPKGHEFTPENTITWHRTRSCRICTNEWARQHRQKKPKPYRGYNPDRWRRYYYEHQEEISERRHQAYLRKKQQEQAA